MSIERVTVELDLSIDCALWRRTMDLDSTNEEIIRSVMNDLLYLHLAAGTVTVHTVKRPDPELTDTDRLRFLNMRYFGATDAEVKAYKEGGRL